MANKYRTDVMICAGTGCKSSGGFDILKKFESELINNDLHKEINPVLTGCFGFCAQGPIVKIFPDEVFYVGVTTNDVAEIIAEHLIKGRPVKRLLYRDPSTGVERTTHHTMGFYRSQVRIALRNCGVINPEKIEEYIALDGYAALGKALTEQTPAEVIDIIKESGLRGRGGGGFPTGLKWEVTKNAADNLKKYVICNADEGDPGAFMDRAILEGDPHSILEAMTIAGFAVGADEGIIYVRAEYPLAVDRLKTAIKQATDFKLLGENILGSDFSFNIHINPGAGAFVCGEETALLNSVQGRRGEPRIKPPFPAQKGFRDKPTLINNVETFANIPPILLYGSGFFNRIGTEESKGTKVFALAGKINNVGLVEVPMGIQMQEIIYNIGGGIRDGKKLKAVQTGGPSGGCLPADMMDTPIDYENLTAAGSMMGSGGLIVLSEDDCMVDIAKFYLEFTVDESCGKCTPCRIGNLRMLEILQRITEGNGISTDIEELENLAHIIKETSLCGLGQTAPNPVLSTINHFHREYEEHIEYGKCRAGRCAALLKYRIIPEKCIGCTLCAKVCPVNCIEGEKKNPHKINRERCISCGACYEKCPVSAITK